MKCLRCNDEMDYANLFSLDTTIDNVSYERSMVRSSVSGIKSGCRHRSVYTKIPKIGRNQYGEDTTFSENHNLSAYYCPNCGHIELFVGSRADI